MFIEIFYGVCNFGMNQRKVYTSRITRNTYYNNQTLPPQTGYQFFSSSEIYDRKWSFWYDVIICDTTYNKVMYGLAFIKTRTQTLLPPRLNLISTLQTKTQFAILLCGDPVCRLTTLFERKIITKSRNKMLIWCYVALKICV